MTLSVHCPPSAIAFAREFCALARSEGDADFTTYKLQKLLYYVQCLAQYERGKDAFSEQVKAWENGPVVPTVFHVLKGYLNVPLGHTELAHHNELDEADRLLVDRIWQRYGHLTGDELRARTHDEMAYIIARDKADEHNNSPAIDAEHMRSQVESQKRRDENAFGSFANGLKSYSTE